MHVFTRIGQSKFPWTLCTQGCRVAFSLYTKADLFISHSMPLQAVQAGPQTDTVHFATWEEHTRGVGSKLMAAMGYRKGAGLGARIKGSAAPIEVHILKNCCYLTFACFST